MAQTRTQIRVAVAGVDPSIPWHARAVDEMRAVAGVSLVAPPAVADVVVSLGGGVVDISCPPAFGIWSFGFGDGARVAGGAPGTLARLYRESEDPGRAVVLHEGWYRAQTADGWGTASVPLRVAHWPARALRQILLGDRRTVDGQLQSKDGCRDRMPPPVHSDFGVRFGDATRDLLRRQRWTVGVVALRLEEILNQGTLPEPAWLRNQPRDVFYADPFVVAAHADRVELLAERYHYATREKTIACLDVSAHGEIVNARAEAGLPHQASYPFLLRTPDVLVCVPETFRARRAAAFVPSRNGSWAHFTDLIVDFPAVDTTIVEREGEWWLFCTRQGDEDQTELHLFHAADWRGPWQPHPLNPVKSDTRSSRPAGACFELGGALYRPAQDCSRRYGGGITINRVLELTTVGFREEPVWHHVPPGDSRWPHGAHTINSCGAMTVVDGLRIEPRLGPARWSGRY